MSSSGRPAPPPVIGLELLASTANEAFGVLLPEGVDRVLGSDPSADVVLTAAGVAPRHLKLRAALGAVEVEPLAGSATLNDVVISGVTRARPGDALRVGEARVLVMQRTVAPPATARHLLPTDAFTPLLVGELSRGLEHGIPMAVCLVVGWGALPELPLPSDAITCTLGTDALGLVWLGATAPEAEAFVRTARAAAPEGEIRVGAARAPGDGTRWEQLVALALERLDGRDELPELVVVDPVMVRLLETLEQLSQSGAPLLLRGEAGSGRAVLARAVHARGPRHAERFVVAHALDDDARELMSLPGTVFVPEVEGLSASSRLNLVQALRRGTTAAVVLGADLQAALAPELETLVARRTVEIPALRDRPRDLLPLAEVVLSRIRILTGRAVPAISGAAARVLEAHRWPGNVRELEAAITLAALSAHGDEVRVEHLPAPVRLSAQAASLPVTDLRREVHEAERQALLAALSSTRWNVTEAAKRLGLPRRTVVYRMSRLGLRRPRPVR